MDFPYKILKEKSFLIFTKYYVMYETNYANALLFYFIE